MGGRSVPKLEEEIKKKHLPHFSHWVPPAGPTEQPGLQDDRRPREFPPANPVLSLPGAPSTGRPFLRRNASVSAISPSVRMAPHSFLSLLQLTF